MNQGLDFGGLTKQLADVVHDSAAALGVVPVPTMIILGLATVFALVGLVVGGQGKDRAARHSHRAHRA